MIISLYPTISHYIILNYPQYSHTNPNIVVASFHVNIALFYTWLTHIPTFTRIFLEVPQGPPTTYAKKSEKIPLASKRCPKKHRDIYIYIYIYRANLQESFQHSGVETIYNNRFVDQSSKQSSQHIWSLENLQLTNQEFATAFWWFRKRAEGCNRLSPKVSPDSQRRQVLVSHLTATRQRTGARELVFVVKPCRFLTNENWTWLNQ